MIRITRQTDYAVLLLAHMVSRPARDAHAAKDLAAGTSLPLPMVSKILKALAREGLLVSHRGVKGGYSLARRADGIMIADVVTALEGPIGITECTHAPGICEQERGCPMRVNWERINGALREALGRVSLAEMLVPAQPPLLRVESPVDARDARAPGRFDPTATGVTR